MDDSDNTVPVVLAWYANKNISYILQVSIHMDWVEDRDRVSRVRVRVRFIRCTTEDNTKTI